jgi:Tfp pilus assembly protein PilF
MNRRYRSSGIPILPVILIITLTLWLISGGCSMLAGYTRLRTMDQREHAARARIQFAVDSLERGESRAADNAIDEAVRIRGNTSDAVASVANDLIGLGRPAPAARILNEALKNETMAKSPLLWARLAKAYDKAGDKAQAGPADEEAERRAQAVLDTIGQQPPLKQGNLPLKLDATIGLFRQTGFYYCDVKKDPEKTFMAFREALRLMPNNPILKNDLGYFLADMGTTSAHFEEALRLTRAAAEAMPDDARVLDSYGWALYKIGDHPAARRVMRTAVDISPNLWELRYHFGRVLVATGETPLALLEMERALLLRPDYTPAKEWRDKLLKETSAAPASPDPVASPKAETLPPDEAPSSSAR